MPSRVFTSPGGGRSSPCDDRVTEDRACLAFGWVCSVTSWQAPNKTPVCVCVCVLCTMGKYNIREGDLHGSRVRLGAIENQVGAQGACLLSCLTPAGVASEGLAWNAELLHVGTGRGQHKNAERKLARQWPKRP